MVQRTERRKRDAAATKARILKSAKREFAKNGLAGARVDVIAERAQVNKRMLYHYFDSKENLFRRILEEAYLDIRRAERKLDLDSLSPPEALERLVRFTWQYFLKNPEFITLVNNENLHQAKHIRRIESLPDTMRGLVHMVERTLRRGEESGDFCSGIDAVQLNITIAAINYYYFTNRYTGSFLYERDLFDSAALDKRLEFNVETILKLVSNPASPQIGRGPTRSRGKPPESQHGSMLIGDVNVAQTVQSCPVESTVG